MTIGDMALRLESAETRLDTLQWYVDRHDRSLDELWTWLPWLYKLYNWISSGPSWPYDNEDQDATEHNEVQDATEHMSA